MKEFIFAALPWVLTGLALAILAADHAAKKPTDEKRDTNIAFGAGVGLLLGVTLNSCGLWENHLLGLTFGPLWGMAVASLISRKEKEK